MEFIGKLRAHILKNLMKPVVDALANKGFVRLKIYLVLQHQNNDHARTVVEDVALQRAADAAWTFVPSADDPQLRPPDGSRTIEHLERQLAQIAEKANDYSVEHDPQLFWEELKASIPEYLEQGGQARDLEEAEIGGRALLRYGYDAHLMAAALATAYSLEGLEAVKSGRLGDAAACAERGTHWISSDFLVDAPRAIFSERAATGGNKWAERFLPVKKLAVQLLSSEMPTGGWRNRSVAFHTVSDILREKYLAEIESCGLKAENLPRTIEAWAKDAPDEFVITVRQL